MNMFAFYAARGWKLDELAATSATERIFLYRAQENFYLEEMEKYRAIFGERR